MAANRTVEIFSAGCEICEGKIEEIRAAACSSCEVTVLDIRETRAAQYAQSLGVRSLPAVAINGVLADCCSNRGPNLETLRAAGLGQA